MLIFFRYEPKYSKKNQSLWDVKAGYRRNKKCCCKGKKRVVLEKSETLRANGCRVLDVTSCLSITDLPLQG